LVRLWLLEERRPGQCQSWYLQSCKFHLQDYIKAGRSVDSPKRNSGRISIANGDGDEFLPLQNDDDAMFGQVSAREIFALLSGRLTPFEQSILNHLSEGLGAREIAQRLEVTHPTVIKYRRRIAALTLRLGISRYPKYQRSPALASAH